MVLENCSCILTTAGATNILLRCIITWVATSLDKGDIFLSLSQYSLYFMSDFIMLIYGFMCSLKRVKIDFIEYIDILQL